ncbi:rhomboid family intramembrane serine protease [Leadbettera azotonutricia]|uniref:Rhomboid family protein n=1 Tax=Leadbettera azotonutricia (strain ATCC BAA-888 / DSM 13862 / ZAS-9) TaxID=545695 RepID=F5Y8N1_LEAAZ|nr:rhomboid family intramembrane serine protease [Leadbettera azotonutricia]AEF80461.1 rhomboid family protein [Leadbettera azotonutricia ZAS-9]
MNFLRKPFRNSQYNVVLILIGLNILVFLGEKVFYNPRAMDITDYLAMNPVLVVHGYLWQFATYMFVHDPFSYSHIIFNMLALFIFGTQVERYMGSTEFLLYYMLTGVLAGVFSFIVYWFTGSYRVFLMGASGAIFAVQLAYAVLFPRNILYLWGILPLRAPVMVLGFTALEIFFMVTGLGGNVAHFTHLAGFAFGWLYFLVRFGINPWRAMRR